MRHATRQRTTRAPLPPVVVNRNAEEDYLEAVFTGTFVSDAEIVDDEHRAMDRADDMTPASDLRRAA